MPSFLVDFAEEIFLCGKYINVIKEFDSSIEIPGFLVRPLHTENFDLNSDLIRESVREVYAWANDTLMEIIRDKKHLHNSFQSVKHFYFGDCGDLLVHFMDLAKEELKKSRGLIERFFHCGPRQTAEFPGTGSAILHHQRGPVQRPLESQNVQIHPFRYSVRLISALKG